MGISKVFKDWLRRRYPAAWFTVIYKRDQDVPYPIDVNVGIMDATFKLKYAPPAIEKGIHYITNHILREATDFLSRPHTEAFFLCFDRGSPVNKGEEHKKRYEKVKPFQAPTLDHVPIIADDLPIPIGDDWKSFANDGRFKQELLYYVTKRIVEEHEIHPEKYTFSPPPNKMLFVFGGTLEKPAPRTQRVAGSAPKFIAEPRVYYVGHEAEGEDVSHRKMTHRFKRVKGCHELFDPNHLVNLLEGEVMACYFAKFYVAGKNVMIISGDGDLIPILLLSSKDRIDPHTGLFRNKVYLRLIIKGKDEHGNNKMYEDVDINLLYSMICGDKEFLNSGTRDPVLLIVASCSLIQCDFIKGYCCGIKAEGESKGEGFPFILKTLLQNLETFKEMVNVPLTDSQRGKIDSVVPIYVDEDLFIRFTEQCYVTKHLVKAEKKRGKRCPEGQELDCVKKYLNSLTKEENRVMTQTMTRVYSRQLQWVLFYWLNGFRRTCSVPSPIATHLGAFSYYGWTQAHPWNCTTAKQVSKRAEMDEFEAFFGREEKMFKEKSIRRKQLDDVEMSDV